MKKFLFVIFSVLLVTLSACNNEQPKDVSYQPQGEFYELKTGNIIPGSSYVGVVNPWKQTNLSPKVGGRISEIHVQEGDNVEAGQLLAELQGDQISTNISSTKNVLSANQKLYENTESFFDKQIEATENKVETAKENMKIAKQQLEGAKTGSSNTENVTEQQIEKAQKQVNEAEISVETTKNKLENTKETLKQKERNIYSNAKNALSNAKIVSTNLMNFVDKNLGISNENNSQNSSFDDYIGAKNSSLRRQTEKQWKEINRDLNEWKKDISSLISDINNTESITEKQELKDKIYSKLQDSQKLLKRLRNLASNMYEVIDSSVKSSSFTQEKINNLKSTAVNYQNKIEETLLTAQGDYLLGIKGSIQSIDNLEKEYSSKTEALQNQLKLSKSRLETAEQTLNQYKAQSQSQVDKSYTELEVAKRKYSVAKQKHQEAKSNLQALKEKKAQQLSQISSTIAKVQGEQDAAGTKFGNTKIYAPYDGVITQKHFDIGQVVSSKNPIITIADKSRYKTKIFVPESEITNIKEGDSTQIKIKSLNKFFTGEVGNIYPSSNISSKRVPVEIDLKSENGDIRIGMYADVYFESEKTDGLKIPQRFIRYKYGEPFIKIYENGEITQKNITIKDCNNEFCIVGGEINAQQKLIND